MHSSNNSKKCNPLPFRTDLDDKKSETGFLQDSGEQIRKPPRRKFTPLIRSESIQHHRDNPNADCTHAVLSSGSRNFRLLITCHENSIFRIQLSRAAAGAQDPEQDPAQNPVQQPAQDPAQEPVQQPAQDQAQNPVQQPVQKPGQEPAENYPERLKHTSLTERNLPGKQPILQSNISADFSAGSAGGDSFSYAFGPIILQSLSCHQEALRAVFSSGSNSIISRVYGLGEKLGTIERTGKVWEFWNTDDPLQTPGKDPLYLSVPFAMLPLHAADEGETAEETADSRRISGTPEPDIWCGLFADMPVHQYWNIAAEDPLDSASSRTITIDAEDAYLDIYLFFASSPKELLAQYARMTGTMPLPPLWALGFHQSRYSYRTDARVREIISEFRNRNIPLDAVHLDIHYMDGFRVFTWNSEQFPDTEALSAYAGGQGVKLVAIVDPGIKAEHPEPPLKNSAYAAYHDGLHAGYFLQNSDGSPYIGEVWPGPAVFPDFFQQNVRSWWAELHDHLFKQGISGIWNDMNEPADFTGAGMDRTTYTVPNYVTAEYSGTRQPLARLHNLYANGMNMSTRLAFSRLLPEKRGFVLTRAGYPGIQRYAAVWTGDNSSWWEHLAAAVPMLLSLSISGIPFVGTDTGGFQENASPELFVRWMQFSMFTPFFRAHTAVGTDNHEPWSFGRTAESIVRDCIKLRYALLPYLYTEFRETSRTGIPIMRPLFLEWPDDPNCAHDASSYLFGNALLIHPAVQAHERLQHVYLPEGRWYRVWAEQLIGETVSAAPSPIDGPADVLVPSPLDRIPVYVRGGSIIPHEEPRLSTQENRTGALRITIFPDAGGAAAGLLYIDEEEGFTYAEGRYSLLQFDYAEGCISIGYLHNSSVTPPWNRMQIRVHSIFSSEPPTEKLSAEIPFPADDCRIRMQVPDAGF